MEPFCRSMACSVIDLLVHWDTLGSAVVLCCEPVNMFAETRKDENVRCKNLRNLMQGIADPNLINS